MYIVLKVNFNSSKLNRLVYCAFCSAITCVLAKIAFPIGPVPISLATLAVYLSGGLLGAKFGALSQLVYLILVLVGFPVAAGLKAGFLVFVGPTGGFLISYVFTAMTVGFFYRKFKGENSNLTDLNKFVLLFVSCVFGTIVCYGFGLIHFMFVLKCGFVYAFKVCVIPFLIGDFLKICIVSFLVPKLEKIINVR